MPIFSLIHHFFCFLIHHIPVESHICLMASSQCSGSETPLWVVPHSKWLIWNYCCHINVECISSIKAIKYIYKYVYKGHDRTTMEFGNCEDEVKMYLDARYVSACESGWRLYHFWMHEEKPAVVRLQVHTENEQLVTWNNEVAENLQEVLENQGARDTTLTAYFKANQEYQDAKDLLYQDFPSKFVWKPKERKWKPRQRVCNWLNVL